MRRFFVTLRRRCRSFFRSSHLHLRLPLAAGPSALRLRRLQRTRVGRGEGAQEGEGKGRGTKGQGARAGRGTTRAFEGGQTPLTRMYPKRGFFNLCVLRSAVRLELQVLIMLPRPFLRIAASASSTSRFRSARCKNTLTSAGSTRPSPSRSSTSSRLASSPTLSGPTAGSSWRRASVAFLLTLVLLALRSGLTCSYSGLPSSV